MGIVLETLILKVGFWNKCHWYYNVGLLLEVDDLRHVVPSSSEVIFI
jgi:hypothetical protein